jgi:hypothetical protein
MENVSDEHVDCMIEPSHLLQLTIQFFEREFESAAIRNILVSSNSSAQHSSRAPTPLTTQLARNESPIPQSLSLPKRAGRMTQLKDLPVFVKPFEPLNSLTSVYKLPPPTSETFKSKMEALLEMDNDVLQYKELIQWLRKLSSSNLFVNVENPESETLFVYQITR